MDDAWAAPPATAAAVIAPTRFPDGSEAPSIVVACTYDPLGLQGPLQVWLRQLTGYSCELQWVGYGMVMDALCKQESVWNANSSGLNVLILRWSDIGDSSEATFAALVDALRARRSPTLVLMPPMASREGAAESIEPSTVAAHTAAIRSIANVTVVDVETLRAALDANMARAWHSPFLDRVAQAPYSPAANSLLASVICRELSRACTPTRKVFCLGAPARAPASKACACGMCMCMCMCMCVCMCVCLCTCVWEATADRIVAKRRRRVLCALLARWQTATIRSGEGR